MTYEYRVISGQIGDSQTLKPVGIQDSERSGSIPSSQDKRSADQQAELVCEEGGSCQRTAVVKNGELWIC